MLKSFLSFFLTMSSLYLSGQELDSHNQEVSYPGGVNRLALVYYGIDFDKEQRKHLKDKQLEFIFHIDKNGVPELSEINGIKDRFILDSLTTKTSEISKFNPRIKNGIPESSIYFMVLEFPSYRMTQSSYGRLQGAAYKEAELEDFEYLTESGVSFECLLQECQINLLESPLSI